MKRVLVAEDEEDIREFVVINLKRSGYDVVAVSNGEDALAAFDKCNGNFDIALLDVMMPPGIDGFKVCKELRDRSNSIGIIILSAKTQEMDKVSGLLRGADDYVVKPFSPAELLARVDAIHRRVIMNQEPPKTTNPYEITSGIFTINKRSHTVTKKDTLIELTQVEFQLMLMFMQNPGAALDRREILKNVWGETYFGDVKVVDVNIRRLRMKIEEDPSNAKYISTVWGRGYKWIPE